MKRLRKMKWLAGILLSMLIIMTCGCGSNTIPAESKVESAMNSTSSLAVGEIPLSSSTFMPSEKTVTFTGRHYLDVNAMAYGFANSNAGISFCFEGTSLELYLSSTAYNRYTYNYVSVYIDNREPVVVCIDKEGWQLVADDLDAESVHRVRVLKRSEANAGAYLIHKIRLSDGARLFEAEKPVTNRRIQVLGDSITCGYGNLWNGGGSEEVTFWEDGTNTYATMLADYFGASLENICISGIGVGNDRNKPYSLLPHYKKQDNFVETDCDFSIFVPDVVIIALGTNDVGQGNGYDDFMENACEMVRFIRQQYPEAYVVWTYGAMGAESYATIIQDTVDRLIEEGETRLTFLQTTPPTQEEGYGLHGHPSLAAHRRMADELIAHIGELTGWQKAQSEDEEAD